MKWEYIAGVLIDMRERSEAMRKLMSSLQVDSESPLYEPFCQSEDDLVTTLAMMVDDSFDAINWYIYECDYGRKPKKAGVKGNKRVIKNIDDLRWLVDLWGGP